MELYFRDNFFSSGETEIMDASGRPIGKVDLRSAFGSSLEIFGAAGESLYEGRFLAFSSKWRVLQAGGEEIGQLRWRMAFFSKRFEYDSYGRGVYQLTSPAMSKEYEIADEDGRIVGRFERVSGWMSAGAFRLECGECQVPPLEWAAVILGMNAMQKQSAAAGGV
ncbi:hypothetical protein NYE40_03850 [Paenibacillus sp. FSL W8-1187]|uniref:Uncharacterized protein n=1 Tax=Paenibacillus pasadenensis TaxID=217090 RepID=A0A2N5N1Q6_9BACL|nr:MULTISPECIES: hypothetical protein [Paenibacillus]PLT44246.1 hypothetical protein B8V81_2677 [Paenibacillus pasadenensis]QGG54771.1 hypothetical protein GE073_03630 [Paenibacillus sp. B01]